MLFRFACGLGLVVLIAILGTAIENRTLDLKRRSSRQAYRERVLREERDRLELETQELSSPARTLRTLDRIEHRKRHESVSNPVARGTAVRE